MASALGILGSMMQGGGEGVRENARRSIKAQEDLAKEQREDEKYSSRVAEQRSYEDGRYAQQRADKLDDAEAQRKHDIELSKLRNKSSEKSSKSNTLLVNRIKSFESQGSKYLTSIDKIETDSLMSPEQKLAAAAPLYARLDELVENNPGMSEFSPLYGSFHSSAKSFLSQFETPEPVNNSNTQTVSNVDSGFVIPIKRDEGATSNVSPSLNQGESEYLQRSPQFIQRAGGVLNRMRANPAESKPTADLDTLRQSGAVRPF